MNALELPTPPTAPESPYEPFVALRMEQMSGPADDQFQLTGEELLLYVATRLSAIDDEVGGLIGQANDALARKEYINDVKEWADRVANAKGDELDALKESFPEAPPGLGGLEHELEALVPSEIDTESMQQFNTQLDGKIDEINGSSEIVMIRLQQLIGQRAVSVQSATGMMKECADTHKAIVGNY